MGPELDTPWNISRRRGYDGAGSGLLSPGIWLLGSERVGVEESDGVWGLFALSNGNSDGAADKGDSVNTESR